MRTLLDKVISFLGIRFPGDHSGSNTTIDLPIPHDHLRELLLRDPVPLYSKEHDLALFWSAKSGCTFGVKWFLHHTDLLGGALEHSSWVHDYREQVLTSSRQFQENIACIAASSMGVVKLVRNPYARAVSSYLMAVRAGYENEPVARFLQRPVDSNNGFSFAEFVDYLATIDLRNCNIHHRLQLHPAEEAGGVMPDYVIQLEESFKQLAECEKVLGLTPADLGQFRKSGHNTAREVWPEFWGEVRLYRHLGTKILPQTANFYDEKLQIKVASLYGADFHHYGYDLNCVPGKEDVELDERAPDQLLNTIREQLPVVGAVEIAGKPVGYWPDSWCARRFEAQMTTFAAAGSVSLSGCLPGGVLSQNTLTVKVNDISQKAEIDDCSDFRVELPVALAKGETVQLRIESAFSKSGIEAELNSDDRQLSFYLKEIAFHAVAPGLNV